MSDEDLLRMYYAPPKVEHRHQGDGANRGNRVVPGSGRIVGGERPVWIPSVSPTPHLAILRALLRSGKSSCRFAFDLVRKDFLPAQRCEFIAAPDFSQLCAAKKF
jgi:hypothetical protein